jgi:hypothetical protein
VPGVGLLQGIDRMPPAQLAGGTRILRYQRPLQQPGAPGGGGANAWTGAGAGTAPAGPGAPQQGAGPPQGGAEQTEPDLPQQLWLQPVTASTPARASARQTWRSMGTSS